MLYATYSLDKCILWDTIRTQRCKFSRKAWEFDVVLNSRHYEAPEQKLSQIYDIASIFTHFCAHVRQLKKFSIDTKFGDLIV